VQITGWLNAETGKPCKQRRNLKQRHPDLKELGCEASFGLRGSICQAVEGESIRAGNSASKRARSRKLSKYLFIVTICENICHVLAYSRERLLFFTKNER
jgi:hypothetical protein